MNLQISMLFALGAMLCWGLGDFLMQDSARKMGNIQVLAFIGIIGSIIMIPFVLKDIPLIFSKSNLLLLLLLGVLTFISGLFDLEALKKGKLSVIDVIISLELPVTIVLAFIFFKESLSTLQFSIIALIFISIILMATKSFKGWKVKLEKGVILALITAIGMGCVNFLTALSSKTVSPLMAVWFPWLVVSLFSFIYIIKTKKLKKFFKNALKFKTLILSMVVFDTAAWLFYAFALSKNELSITTAITESYPAIALFLGVWLNKEKIKWYQYLGAVLALVFSFVLILLV